ncbi:hypothetical protein KC717_00250 [Candidatus Dojkabacteria bacterium]|uniref:Baseplate protein J-like domain-containing protein n=1 Tax=Candidatus Dojkabacteria bacterium TaxID=2099670 RepID=A0A955L770_9BACT|nr:hypothetical protein [Candidatus Dojkabacteria bacterium]
MSERTRETASTKIFVDADEDIVFIIEKILHADSDRVLLVVPKHASLTSSIVNLKLISRELTDTSKVVILITSSELAQNKSEETHLLAFEKVDSVNDYIWEDAQVLITTLTESRKELKEKLIAARKESNTPLENLEPRPEFKYTHSDPEDAGNFEITTPTLPTQKITPTRLVEKGGFSIFAGGDITMIEEDIKPPEEKKSSPEVPEKPINPVDTNEDKTESEEDINIPVKDIRHHIPLDPPKPKEHFVAQRRQHNNSKPKQKSQKVSPRSTRRNTSPLIKKYATWIIIGILLYIGLSYVLRKASVEITTQDQSISISEQAEASRDVSSIQLEDKVAPMHEVSISESVSESALATGEANAGEKATGLVDITNKTNDQITLEAGTPITTLSDNLVFTLAEQVVLQPKYSDISFFTLENVPIVASDYGDEYNVSGVDVKIAEYKTSSEVSGRIYKKVQGGTSDLITVVSQEDVDTLKTKLIESIEPSLTEKIANELSDDEIIIPGSEVYEEVVLETSIPVGEEAKEFDITNFEYQMKVLVVAKDDINQIANHIITQQYGEETSEFLLDSTEIEIDNLQLQEDGKAIFTIKKSVSVPAIIDTEEVFSKIQGLSPAEAKSKLEDQEEIEIAEVSISPFFSPPFFRVIPTSPDRFEVIVVE